jgi:anionic cell wall polymer biosynthesis LytR-Cps2A-Psr (LCP) family protein
MLFIVTQWIDRGSSDTNAQNIAIEEKDEEAAAPLILTLYGDIYTSDHTFETYLFIGTDNTSAEIAEGEDYHGDMADFLNLLIIDHTAQTYSVLAIDRDTISEIPVIEADGTLTGTGFFQICVSQWYGGDRTMNCENTVAAVSTLLGSLPIDGYFAMAIDDMPRVNSLVGGVTVTIEDDGLTAIDPAFEKGVTITLSDEQAVAFVQARMSVGNGTNIERMARQSQYLTALSKQLKGRLRTEPELALTLYDEMYPDATTDMNGNTVSRLANDVLTYTDNGEFQFEGTSEVGQLLEDGLDHVEFYVDSENMMDVMVELFSLEFQES